METSYFFTEKPFDQWGLTHLIPIIIFLLIGVSIIIYAKQLSNRTSQKKILLYLSLLPLVSFVIYLLVRICTGTFTIQEDLPIHICRLLAVSAPLVYLKENKFWTGIFYFWILVGTLNAVFSADIKYDFPHWNYFVYFSMHAGLVILPFFYCIVLKHRITLKDMWNAFWVANVLLISTMAINFTIGSNYMFTRHKPETASLMDLLGPWPWYLVGLQFIALGFFILIYLPFYFTKNRK